MILRVCTKTQKNNKAVLPDESKTPRSPISPISPKTPRSPGSVGDTEK
jgi:hypothetical protein